MPPFNIVIVLDNHSAHKSKLVSDYAQLTGFTLFFLPPYSSPLNPIERVWSRLKRRWAKYLSRITVKYNMDNIERDIRLVTAEVERELTFNCLHASDDQLLQV